MTLDVGKVASLLDKVSKNFIVRPTGIPNVIGLSGFVFDVIENEEITLSAEITDHYVEDNTVISDHIALKPEMFTVRGFVGELTQLFDNDLLEVVTDIQRLAVLALYQPTFSPQTSQNNNTIIDQAEKAISAVELAQNFYEVFSDKNTSANKQQRAFNFFYSMYLSRQLFTVETPYNIFENMAIETCRLIQDKVTNQVTDIGITFKKIRTIETEFIASAITSGRSSDMFSDVVEKGLSQGQSVTGINFTRFFTG